MDEVELRIKGKTDDWRIQRACANLIHRSLVEKPCDVKEQIPLPYDDELELIAHEDDAQIWEESMRNWYRTQEKQKING